jgi:hypothetical protein
MDDILLEIKQNDPQIILDKVSEIFAKYGLELNKNKCKFTSPFSDDAIEFMNLPLNPK